MSDLGLWSQLTGLTGRFTSSTESNSDTSQASHCANVEVCQCLMKFYKETQGTCYNTINVEGGDK